MDTLPNTPDMLPLSTVLLGILTAPAATTDIPSHTGAEKPMTATEPVHPTMYPVNAPCSVPIPSHTDQQWWCHFAKGNIELAALHVKLK